jgi:menaquinone-dependent protoporphyrinogen oxidase
MTVLVAYASKHGATYDIAERIAEVLRRRGHAVEVHTTEAVHDAGAYEAAVIGSAVYFGRWRPQAVDFVSDNRSALAGHPVWLFSSGPLGDHPETEPDHLAELRDAVDARDHRTFFGALDRERLSLGERLVTKAVQAPYGDFRDWAEIDAWADGIAEQLKAVAKRGTP